MSKSAEVFKQIDSAFKSFDPKEAEKLAKQAKAVFQFVIKGKDGVKSFTVDLKSGKPQVKEGKAEKADVKQDSNKKEGEGTMGKSVETNEAKVQSSSPPLAPKISFPHRLKKQKDGE